MEPERKIIACSFAFSKELTEAGQFEGHAAVFGNIDLQGDKIKRGAFAETIEESAGRWPVLMAHSLGRVVGFSTGAEEDSKGLKVAGEFTLDSDEGRNAYATARHAAKLGQKFGLSIGYAIRGENGASYDESTNVRTLKNLTVYEFSLAAVPANPRARIAAVKELEDIHDWTIREFEKYLRESGFSKEAARAIASRGFKAFDRSEADETPDDEGARALMSAVARESILLKGL
jgi:HK97 family phage prohead protease